MRPVTRALVCLLLWSALTACGVWGAATGQGPKEIRLSADPPARKRAVEGAGDAYDVHGGDKVQIRVVAVAQDGTTTDVTGSREILYFSISSSEASVSWGGVVTFTSPDRSSHAEGVMVVYRLARQGIAFNMIPPEAKP